MYSLYILIFGSIIFSFAECGFFKKNERIWANAEQFKSCATGSDNKLKLNINSRKYNRTHTGVNFNITLNEPFGKQYMLDTELQKWGDGGWKRNFFRYSREDACSTIYLMLGKIWNDLMDAVHAEQSCPVKAGFYTFHDFYIDASKLPLFTAPGKYLFSTRAYKHRILQACIEVLVNVQTELIT